MSRRRAPAAATLAIVAAVGLAGCGSFDSKTSGEDLIKAFITKAGKSEQVTLGSVSCPSGIADNVGTSYDCKVTLREPNGKRAAGTITVHIISGHKVQTNGARDVHVG